MLHVHMIKCAIKKNVLDKSPKNRLQETICGFERLRVLSTYALLAFCV